MAGCPKNPLEIARRSQRPQRTDRTPFLREIMDCLSPSSLVETVVLMKGAQVGGTECGKQLDPLANRIFRASAGPLSPPSSGGNDHVSLSEQTPRFPVIGLGNRVVGYFEFGLLHSELNRLPTEAGTLRRSMLWLAQGSRI